MLRTLVGAIGTSKTWISTPWRTCGSRSTSVHPVDPFATPDATLVVVVDPHEEELVIEASAACETHDVVSPGSFSWHVLTSLADDVQTSMTVANPMGPAVFRYQIDGAADSHQQVTVRTSGSSASRPNEYADVPEMFRELAHLAPTRRNSRATGTRSWSGAYRWPTISPAASKAGASHATTGSGRAVDWSTRSFATTSRPGRTSSRSGAHDHG